MKTKAKKHSFIHDIKIASPCPADWNTMTGDDCQRFCGQCQLNVYNIAEMTMDDAEILISESEGKVCLRLFRRKDGTVITKDCPKGVAAVRAKMVKMWCAATALIAFVISYRGPSMQQSLMDRFTCNVNAVEPLGIMGGGSAPPVRELGAPTHQRDYDSSMPTMGLPAPLPEAETPKPTVRQSHRQPLRY